MWPTISTPCSSRLNAYTAPTPKATATSEAGTTGSVRFNPSTSASDRRPTASVRRCVSPSFVTRSQSFSKKSPEPLSTPNSAGSWPTMIVSARPMTNPLSTGSEMRLATNPRRASPATTPQSPVATARPAVSAA